MNIMSEVNLMALSNKTNKQKNSFVMCVCVFLNFLSKK